MSCSCVPFWTASFGRRAMLAVVRRNEVLVFRVAPNVAGHEGTARDHREAPGARVLQRDVCEPAGKTTSLQLRGHLGVHEDNVIALSPVFDDREMAVHLRFIALRYLVIGDADIV